MTSLRVQVRQSCCAGDCPTLRVQGPATDRSLHPPPAQLPALAPVLPAELEEELNLLLGAEAGLAVEVGVPLDGPLSPLASVSGWVPRAVAQGAWLADMREQAVGCPLTPR